MVVAVKAVRGKMGGKDYCAVYGLILIYSPNTILLVIGYTW